MIHLIVLLLAFVLFLVAAARPAHPDAPRLLYCGLALWVLSQLLGAVYPMPVGR
jgi:hypothetical protein